MLQRGSDHSVTPDRVRAIVRRGLAARDFAKWTRSGFPSISPRAVKWHVLNRWSIPGAGWIETGTYRGDTTAFLARSSPRVVSIEADQHLAARARSRFRHATNIEIQAGESQTILPEVLKAWQGPANFWLDGHYSGPGTHLGTAPCPILEELKAISDFVAEGHEVAVFIDDSRCFDGSTAPLAGYPPLSTLVTWAEHHRMKWAVEHDIFLSIRADGHSS